MGDPVAERLKYGYRLRHCWFLSAVEDLTEEQLAWRPTPTAHSIAWNLWHVARWADDLHAKIPQMTPSLAKRLGPAHQIWTQEDLAATWGLDCSVLGWGETGMEMDDKAAATLRLPGKDPLVAYARRAFAAAERAVDAIDDEESRAIYKSPVEWEGKARSVVMSSVPWHTTSSIGARLPPSGARKISLGCAASEAGSRGLTGSPRPECR